MEMPKEFYDMVCSDIQRIEGSDQLSSGEKLKLHRELDGRYQACIKDWYKGLWGSDKAATIIYYSSLHDSPSSVQENLQMNAITLPKPPETKITVNNTVNISLSFKEAKQKIEDMTALNREQTDEILAKIDELEKISKENISRKSKWEKVKPIIAFALDKGADVAIAILSLILQMKLGA